MRKLFASTVAVLAMGLAFTGAVSSAGIVDAPLPLKVKIKTLDGKKRIKVARKLKTVMSCSKDCHVTVNFAVKTPAGTISDSSTGSLSGKQIVPLRIRLNGVALRYLKKNYKRCRFRIRVKATDRGTGKHVAKTRSFRFYR